MKTKIIALIALISFVFIFASVSNTFAFLGINWSNITNFNQIKTQVIQKMPVHTVTKVAERVKKISNQAEKHIEQQKLEIIKKQNEIRTQIIKNKSTILKKVEDKIKDTVAIKAVEDDPNAEKVVKNEVKNKLRSVITDTTSNVGDDVKKKLGDKLKSFRLNDSFDPDKVITFDDIKNQAISNLMIDQKLLECDEPDDSMVSLCSSINNLLSDLNKSNKKLTINDVYKLQVYQHTISQAIFYNGILQQYKKGTIILGIDKSKNVIKSVDLVRNYTMYDMENNDVLPLKSKSIDINVYSSRPVLIGNDPSIIVGLNGGSLRGLKIYPLDKDISISGATKYKVMTIKGYVKGCSNYTDSFWYGNGKIGFSHNGKNLEPAGTRGIKFNVVERCYDVFGKGGGIGLNVSFVSVCNASNLGKKNNIGKVCIKKVVTNNSYCINAKKDGVIGDGKTSEWVAYGKIQKRHNKIECKNGYVREYGCRLSPTDTCSDKSKWEKSHGYTVGFKTLYFFE